MLRKCGSSWFAAAKVCSRMRTASSWAKEQSSSCSKNTNHVNSAIKAGSTLLCSHLLANLPEGAREQWHGGHGLGEAEDGSSSFNEGREWMQELAKCEDIRCGKQFLRPSFLVSIPNFTSETERGGKALPDVLVMGLWLSIRKWDCTYYIGSAMLSTRGFGATPDPYHPLAGCID